MSGTVSGKIKDDALDIAPQPRDGAETSGSSTGDWLDAVMLNHGTKTSMASLALSPMSREARTSSIELKAAAAASVIQRDVQDFAATGTEGPLRSFVSGERPSVRQAGGGATARMPEPDHGPGARGRTEESPASRRSPLSGTRTMGQEAGHLKEQMIRDAVAAITRRQMALDGATPSSATAAPGDIDLERGEDPGVARHAMGSHGGKPVDPPLVSRATDQPDRPTPLLADPVPGGQASVSLDEEAKRAFETLGQDLRKAIETLDPRLRNPEDGVNDRARRFEERPRSAPDPLATAALVPSRIADTAGRSVRGPVATVAGDREPASAAVWDDVRALLDRFDPGSAIETLDRSIQNLASKVERHLDGPASSPLIEDISRRIDALQTSIQRPSVDHQGLDHLLGAIEERFIKARGASADIQHIEDMMAGLARRMEEARPQPDAGALSALQERIERLGERLDRSDASLSSLDTVERSLRDLFFQLEKTRDATIDAAEHAARTAARDTLRAAMRNPAVTGGLDMRADLTDKVAQDIQDLRLRHEASERRTQVALSGLHQAVEKLVSQIGPSDGIDAMPAAISDDTPVTLSGRSTADPVPETLPSEIRAQRRAPDASIVDSLIEPGEGRAPRRAVDLRLDPVDTEAVRQRAPLVSSTGEGTGVPSSLIAAARRAAQSAQASAASQQRPETARQGVDGSTSPVAASALALLERARSYLTSRRRPILLSLAGLVLMLGALEVVKVSRERPSDEQPAIAREATPPAKPVVAQAADDGPAAPASAPAVQPRLEAVAPPTPDTSAPEPAPVIQATNPFLIGALPGASGIGEGLKAMALKGDPAAEFEIGLRYAEGRSVARDPAAAAGWFEKAAAQGLAPAQYRLGSAYEKGLGEPRDAALAGTWYGRAADAGNIRAMHNLAVMAAEGAVGKPDYAKAATLFGKAAALGVRDSQFNLAILYARGLGIEQNLAQSYTWFAIAAAQGDDDAAKKRDEVAARLDPKALDAAKAVAASFAAAPSIASANDVTPPAGGWDAVAPPAPTARSDAARPKPAPAKASTM